MSLSNSTKGRVTAIHREGLGRQDLSRRISSFTTYMFSHSLQPGAGEDETGGVRGRPCPLGRKPET